jgi:hypothetical protein
LLYGRFNVTPGDVFAMRGLAIRPEVQQLVEDLNARSRPQPVAVTTAAALPQQSLTPFGAQQPVVSQAPVPVQPATVQPVPVQPVPVQQPGALPVQAPPLVPIQVPR